MTIPIHRHSDLRICGATTVVVKQSTVYANRLLIAVHDDPNTHGGGDLISSANHLYVEGIRVVNHTADNAKPDGLCPISPHCNPQTAEGSPNVKVPDGDCANFYDYDPRKLAAQEIGSVGETGLSESDSESLRAEAAADRAQMNSRQNRATGGGSSAPYGAGNDIARNEYGEAYNGVNSAGGTTTPPTTSPTNNTPSGPVDPNLTATSGIVPRSQNLANRDSNRYAQVPDDNLLRWGVYAGEGRQVDPGILAIARAMARAAGTTLTVNSGYRSGTYNDTLKGAARNSAHTRGNAMDISFAGLSDAVKQRMLAAAIEAGAGGIGIYPESNNLFIHVDIEAKRTWRAHPPWSQSLMRSAGYI